MKPLAVEIQDLCIESGGRDILSVARLEIPEGEFVTLLGPNGAGKSTLLRRMIGFGPSGSGRVRVLGQDIHRWQRRLAALRRRVGYVPQGAAEGSEIPLTAREVVAIGRTGIAGLFRRLGREDWHQVDHWIERLGLSRVAGQGYSDLSGGERRKVLIARAMVQNPEMLLLDEPAANLDVGWREWLVKTMNDLFQIRNLTVILVCHELESIPPVCRRAVVLEAGRVRVEGTPEHVLSSQLVADLFGPGLTVAHRGGRWAILPEEMRYA